MCTEIFIFYAEAPIAVPEDKRVTVAEYMTRVNFGMRIGNMEMDMNDLFPDNTYLTSNIISSLF